MRCVRLAAMFAVSVIMMDIWAAPSLAAVRSLTGSARYQIGNGLPIPITEAVAPDGGVPAIFGATVSVTSGAGHAIRFLAASQLAHPGTKRTIGVFPANNAVFQVATALAVGFPAAPGTLGVGLRTGPAVVTWCPGTAAPVAGAPGCGVFPSGGVIPGGIRYTATGAQFGGPLRAKISGLATVALQVGGTPPGFVTGIHAFASPAGMAAIGGPFNVKVSTAAAVPGPASGVFVGVANAAGTITSVLSSGIAGSGIANVATSYGAPWTTGRITVSNLAASPVETFILSGSDLRTPVSGLGTISLVSGAISARLLTGPNANRGWLNLEVIPAVPALPPGALAAATGLLALAGGYLLRRRSANATSA